jgi:hypothetical protein
MFPQELRFVFQSPPSLPGQVGLSNPRMKDEDLQLTPHGENVFGKLSAIHAEQLKRIAT